MADLVAHDMTTFHQKIFLRIIDLNTIPGWVVPTEGESANTFSVACPSKAERPAILWVQVLHRYGEHSIRVCRPISRHDVKEPALVASFVLDRGLVAHAARNQ